MKTLRSERIQNSPVLPFSTSSPPEVNVPRKESTTIFHGGSENISSLENQIFHENDLRKTAKRETFASLTTQHLRSRRQIDSKSEYTQEDLLMCNESIINIKYDDEYKVRTDLSILYKNTVYDYTEYRVLNDSINICNSTDNNVRNIWKARNKWVKAKIHKKSCNKPIGESWLNRQYYTGHKQFTVYYVPTSQYLTRNYYGVEA
jgi:type II secretory pathway component PulJ